MSYEDLVVYRRYEKQGIGVIVKIDRINKSVTLVDYDRQHDRFVDKRYEFVNRSVKYMDGWLAILRAISYAVEEAKKELEAVEEKDLVKLVSIFQQLDKVQNERQAD